jgi:hypothetical protein
MINACVAGLCTGVACQRQHWTLHKHQCRHLAEAEYHSIIERRSEDEIQRMFDNPQPSDYSLLLKLSAISWTLRPHLNIMHVISLRRRAALLEVWRPAPGDTKEKVVCLLKRAATELSWPELPAGTEDMFNAFFRALNLIATFGEPEVAVEILSRHVEDVEKHLTAPNHLAIYLIYRLDWLLLVAWDSRSDTEKGGTSVSEARGMLKRVTGSLRGLQSGDWSGYVSDRYHFGDGPSAWLMGRLFGCVQWGWPLSELCTRIQLNLVNLCLHSEVIDFGRKLVQVAPPSLQVECIVRSVEAMLLLQKLDEAEEMVHEGLAACGQEGTRESRVSPNDGMVVALPC